MSVRSARYNLLSLRNPKGLTVIPEERDAWAFLDAAKITSSREQRAVIDLVRGLKHAQLWSKMKAIYPFVGGTATTHKFNLKDPRDADVAYRLTFSGGWTHASTGATPNGTNAWADTFLIPSTNLNSLDSHGSCYLTTNNPEVINDYYIFGSYTDTSDIGFFIDNYRNPATSFKILSAANAPSTQWINYTHTTHIGLITTNIVGSGTNQHNLFTNDQKVSSNTSTNGGKSTYKISIAALNYFGTILGYSFQRFAFACFGDGLSDANLTNLYNIVQRFQTSLGRQV